MTTPGPLGPLRVSVISPSPCVLAGLTTLAQRHPERAVVVESLPRSPISPTPADVRVYDVAALAADGGRGRTSAGAGPPVLLFAREGQPVPAALQGSPTVGLVREDVSSAGLLAEIERAAGREPVEATEDPPNRAALLTPREADVIRLIAAGHSNVDIARELFVSINSVKSYIRSAYKVIGVTNRSGAILWAIRYGMVATPRSHDEPPAAAPGGGGLDAPALQPAG